MPDDDISTVDLQEALPLIMRTDLPARQVERTIQKPYRGRARHAPRRKDEARIGSAGEGDSSVSSGKDVGVIRLPCASIGKVGIDDRIRKGDIGAIGIQAAGKPQRRVGESDLDVGERTVGKG